MIKALEPLWPVDVEGVESLIELAFDLRVPWKHSSDEIWGQLEPELWSLTHNPVRVEVFAEEPDGGEPFRRELSRGEPLVGSTRGFIYTGRVPATRAADDYTVRVIAQLDGAVVPLEASQILWQR